MALAAQPTPFCQNRRGSLQTEARFLLMHMGDQVHGYRRRSAETEHFLSLVWPVESVAEFPLRV